MMTSDESHTSLPATAVQIIGRFLAGLGPLRVALLVLSLAAVVLAPSPDTPTVYDGFGLFRTVLLPTFVPLYVSGLLFDALMAKVVMGDADESGRRRLRMVIRTDLAVTALLVIVWLPFFMAIGN